MYPAPYRGNIGLTGTYYLVLRDKHGNVKFQRKQKNLITSAGENLVATRMNYAGGAPAVPQYIAFGTDSTTADKTQTALGAEFVTARVAAGAGTTTLNLLHLEFTVVPAITMANVAEVGVFNALTVGTMFSRTVLSPFTMGTSDSLAVVWELTFEGVD